jgi:hypothetical protein
MEILRSPISRISENMRLLRRDFLMQDLMDVFEESDIEAVVTVQPKAGIGGNSMAASYS